ncbi:MAG: sulfatase, partial [Candidatus Eisenbacteria bacterium]|nr:sulfatase [Candidatus Eisenbacteria bacterium]
MRRAIWWGGVVLLLAAGAFWYYRAHRSPPDVLLITIDTLRADHLGLYGYERDTTPALDRWFDDALIFERAYSTDANTSPSVMSLLSGRYPQDHRVRLLYQLDPGAAPLLPALLPEVYQTAGFVSNVVLTEEAIGIGHYFDHYDDYVDQPEPLRPIYERNAARTTDAVLAWLAESRDRDRPLFLWVHYIDPHGPYLTPPGWKHHFHHEGRVEIDTTKVPEYQRINDEMDGLDYVDRYDEEIAYMDSEVGRLLDGCAKLLDLDDALVVFTADHGETMMQGERWFAHGYHVYEPIVHVPLMLRGRGVPSGRRSGVVSLADLVPTLLRVTDGKHPDEPVDPTAGWSGIDLVRGGGEDPDRVVFSEGSYLAGQVRAAITQRRKWMALVERGTHTVRARRFYELDTDPLEERARDWPEPLDARADSLLRLIASDPDPGGIPDSLREGIQIDAPKVAPNLTEEQREKL